MPDRSFPILHVRGQCEGCPHEQSESYAVQGDSGVDYYCAHPEVGAVRKRKPWNTPDWCPLLPAARARLVAELSQKDNPGGA